MFLCFYLLYIFLGLLLNKKKWFPYLIIIFLAIITFFHPNCADFNSYQSVYRYIMNGNSYLDTGVGWLLINRIFGTFKIDFLIFKTCIVAISLLLFHFSLKDYLKDDNNKGVFWLLYLIFPSLLDIIQFRFLFASSLFVYFFKLSVSEKKFENNIFILIIILISTIHSSFIFFIPFFILFRIKLINRILPLMYLLLIIVGIIFKNNFFDIVKSMIGEQRIDRYFLNSSDSTGIIGLIVYSSIIALNILVSYSIKILNNNSISKIVFGLNTYLIIIIPLLVFDTNNFRLVRPITMLNYINVLLSYEKNGYYNLPIKKINSLYIVFSISIIENVILFSGVSFDEFIRLLT